MRAFKHRVARGLGRSAADGKGAAACKGGAVIAAFDFDEWCRDDVSDPEARDRLHAVARLVIQGRPLEEIQRKAARVGLARGDVQAANSMLLSRACSRGRLDVARWLAEAYALGPQHGRVQVNDPLQRASKNGHLAVVAWLIDTFGLTPEDADEARALFYAHGNGHEDVTSRLLELYSASGAPVTCR